jgi:MYXO-CTERM domain-containing protein
MNMDMRTLQIAFGLATGLLATSASAATVEIAAGDDVEAAIAALQPGDELVLGGGMYTVTERFSIDLTGNAGAPILIRAKDGEVPHIHRPDAAQNLVDIDNAQYVELRGIEWSGGSAGLRISSAQFLTIADCEIHDTGDVAVRANDTGAVYEGLHIVGNNIHDTNDTGEGMYLGCNDGGCQVIDSVIERNWVHDTNGPTIVQGDGIELKEGSSGNVIRDNVIHDTNYPCILTYSALGGEANVIEGNVMWNCGDHAIQSAADAIIRNNIILSAAADGIAMQPHQSGDPSNLVVVHNTVVIPGGTAIAVSGATGAVTIANNAVYSMSGPAIEVGGDTTQITVANNIGLGGFGGGGGYADGNLDADFVAATFSGGPPNDVFPADGALVGAGDPAYATAVDFNTLAVNDPPDVGAYAYDPAGNPGWAIAAEFKQFPDDVPGGDSGGSDDGGNDGTGGGGSDGPGADSTAGSASADGGSGGGASSGPISGGTDSAGGDGGGGGDDGGCSCQSTGNGRPATGALGLFSLLALGLRRRRR